MPLMTVVAMAVATVMAAATVMVMVMVVATIMAVVTEMTDIPVTAGEMFLPAKDMVINNFPAHAVTRSCFAELSTNG